MPRVSPFGEVLADAAIPSTPFTIDDVIAEAIRLQALGVWFPLA